MSYVLLTPTVFTSSWSCNMTSSESSTCLKDEWRRELSEYKPQEIAGSTSRPALRCYHTICVGVDRCSHNRLTMSINGNQEIIACKHTAWMKRSSRLIACFCLVCGVLHRLAPRYKAAMLNTHARNTDSGVSSIPASMVQNTLRTGPLLISLNSYSCSGYIPYISDGYTTRYRRSSCMSSWFEGWIDAVSTYRKQPQVVKSDVVECGSMR